MYSAAPVAILRPTVSTSRAAWATMSSRCVRSSCVTVIVPVFYGAETEPSAFVAARGHHADIGGTTCEAGKVFTACRIGNMQTAQFEIHRE